MKSFTVSIAAALLGVLLCRTDLVVASTRSLRVEKNIVPLLSDNSSSSSSPTQQQQVRIPRQLDDYDDEYDEYEPWEWGTDVYYYDQEQDQSYWGDISHYSDEDGSYTIVWRATDDQDEEEEEVFFDTDEVDDMVEDAAFVYYNGEDADENEPWDYGTDVYVVEDNVVYWGQITDYRDGTYTTTWEDGEVEYYDEGEDLDDLVYSAFEKRTGSAVPDSGNPDSFEHDFTEQDYQVGTAVWHPLGSGLITDYDESTGSYTIEWEDGQTQTVWDEEEMHGYVANAVALQGTGGRGTDGGASTLDTKNATKSGAVKFGIAVAVLVSLAGIVFVLYKKMTKQGKKSNDLNLKSTTDTNFS